MREFTTYVLPWLVLAAVMLALGLWVDRPERPRKR